MALHPKLAVQGLALLLATSSLIVGGLPVMPSHAQDEVPEIAALLPESVRAAGTLRIAIPDVGRPLAFQDGQELGGMDPALGRAVAGVLGLEPELSLIPFASALTGLQADRYDISYGEFYVTAERLLVADFVTNWQDFSTFLVVSDGDFQPTSLGEICGRQMGAMAGSAELEILTTAAEDCSSDAPNINAFPSVNNAVLALNSGRVDAVLVGRGSAEEGIQQDSSLTASGEIGGGPTATAVARNDNSEAMLAAIKAAYDHLIQSGEYAEILEANGTAYGAVTEAEIYTEGSTPPDYSF